MAASDTQARQASVNEPSGARLVRGDWVGIGHCAHDHGAQLELQSSKCRLPQTESTPCAAARHGKSSILLSGVQASISVHGRA